MTPSGSIAKQTNAELLDRLQTAVWRDVWPSGDWDTIDGGQHRREVALGPRKDGRQTILLILAEIGRRLETPFD